MRCSGTRRATARSSCSSTKDRPSVRLRNTPQYVVCALITELRTLEELRQLGKGALREHQDVLLPVRPDRLLLRPRLCRVVRLLHQPRQGHVVVMQRRHLHGHLHRCFPCPPPSLRGGRRLVEHIPLVPFAVVIRTDCSGDSSHCCLDAIARMYWITSSVTIHRRAVFRPPAQADVSTRAPSFPSVRVGYCRY
jgi:hypothetical protein